VIHSVLKEVKLTALVGDASETGFDGTTQALMIVANYQADAMEAALLK